MSFFYHWRSDALKQYGSGWIIVSAPDVEFARELVREQAPTNFISQRDWLNLADPDDKAELKEHLELIDRDIAVEPTVSAVLFINGSE